MQPDCLTTEATRIESQLPEGKLLGFYAHVGELSKVLIEGGHRQIGVNEPFACSREVVPTTGSFSRSRTDLCEGHALAFLAGKHTLQ